MSIITVQCRLVASETVRRQIWNLMTTKNTPLVNKLVKLVNQQAEFETWLRQGKLPQKTVRNLCKPLRTDPCFVGQPGRFYTSAELMTTYIYESWLALQQKRQRRLDNKRRWLNIVKSDAELVAMCQKDIPQIRAKAEEILAQEMAQLSPTENQQAKSKKRRRKATPNGNISLMSSLFKLYEKVEGDELTQCAIAYLIKNNCQLTEQQKEEDVEAFSHRIHRKKKEIERLEEQLKSCLPQGRDLTEAEFLETLAIATHQIPTTESEQAAWQAKLLAKPATMPYPILFGSQTDLEWSKNEKGRICVCFVGFMKHFENINKHSFQIYCDQRHLPFFQRFLEDWQAYEADGDNYPLGLTAIRSATLFWEEGDGQGDPWNVNYLKLHCAVDIQLMTAEGTENLRQQKMNVALQKLSNAEDESQLTSDQQEYIKRTRSSIARLSAAPYRPSQPPYQGNPDILVGVSFGLTQPVQIAVVDGSTGRVITYRNPRQLLGDNYSLLNRQKQQQQANAHQRHKNQRLGRAYQPSESELGLYIDRLLAKSIVDVAQHYQAGSIVLPTTTYLRERLMAEINAKAEQKTDSKVVQNQYAKACHNRFNRWSYARLAKSIQNRAEKIGIPVETGFQPMQRTQSEKARDLAIATYHFRQTSTN